MAKKFVYKGPGIIPNCIDCLYCQIGSEGEGEVYCAHPDSAAPENISWMVAPEVIPEWCPLPEAE